MLAPSDRYYTQEDPTRSPTPWKGLVHLSAQEKPHFCLFFSTREQNANFIVTVAMEEPAMGVESADFAVSRVP
jgi:hypothetical protein